MNNLQKIAAVAIASASTGEVQTNFLELAHPTVVSNNTSVWVQDTLTVASNSVLGHIQIVSSTVDVTSVEENTDEATASLARIFYDWGPEAEQRFAQLVDLEADGKLADGEFEELAYLESLRFAEISPMTYDQIKRERELERLTRSANAVIDDLIAYAEKYYNIKTPEASA